MADSLRRRTKLAFLCPKCERSTERSIDWLARHKKLECDNCGRRTDLTTDKNRALINQFEAFCDGLY